VNATADHDRWWRTLPAQGSDRDFGALQLAEHVRQQVGNGDDPRLASLADERDPPSLKVDLLGAPNNCAPSRL
jgi:hypothetical protein